MPRDKEPDALWPGDELTDGGVVSHVEDRTVHFLDGSETTVPEGEQVSVWTQCEDCYDRAEWWALEGNYCDSHVPDGLDQLEPLSEVEGW